jgi:hypothetical protein
MTRRRHGSKVTFALWSLVVLALLTSGLGVMSSLILMGALGLVAGAATTVWVLARQAGGEKRTSERTRLPVVETGPVRSGI